MPSNAKKRRGSETRDALLQAATVVIEQDGIAAATTRRVADEAGLPLGTVHYWFADKTDLLSAVIEVLIADVRAQIIEDAEDETIGDRVTRIHGRITGMPVGRQLALSEVTTHAIRSEGLHDLAREQYAAYTDAAMRGLSSWEVAADARLPGGARALATLIVAVTDGLALARLASPDSPDPGAALALFAHLLGRTEIDAEVRRSPGS